MHLALALAVVSTAAPAPLPEFAQRLADATNRAIRADRHPTYEEVKASLTPAERKWLKRYCGKPIHFEAPECGYINTPLVLVFGGARVAFTTGATFDFAPGVPARTDWPTASTPWLARDLDGNGRIDSGAELFGSNTVLPGGERAVNGFEALAALDSNHDGAIDAADEAFGSLVLWAGGKVTPLSRVVSRISLDVRTEERCDLRGNCERERASFVAAGGSSESGEVVDVYLPTR